MELESRIRLGLDGFGELGYTLRAANEGGHRNADARRFSRRDLVQVSATIVVPPPIGRIKRNTIESLAFGR
jgi:hypothetical protein